MKFSKFLRLNGKIIEEIPFLELRIGGPPIYGALRIGNDAEHKIENKKETFRIFRGSAGSVHAAFPLAFQIF